MIIKFINHKSLDDNLKIEILSKDKIYKYNNIKKYIKCNLDYGVYKLNLYNKYGLINTYVLIIKSNETIYIHYNYYRLQKVIIRLTDYHYNNLPIESGNVILWEKV